MRNPMYEQTLTKNGLQWEYLEHVPLTEINVTRGKQMQARLEPLDHDLIDQYAKMIDNGLLPPPLLLWRQGRGMYVPLDGNQRLAANAQAKHKLKAFDAYLLKTDDPMVADRTCWQFNNMVNGRRLSYEECFNHALTMSRKYNQPAKQVAKDWGVKEWELLSQIKLAEMRELAQSRNVHLPPAMSDKCLIDLSALRTIGDDLAVKAVKVSAENGLTHDDVTELLKDVRVAKDSAAKFKTVEEFAKSEKVARRRAETKGGRVRHMENRLPRVQLQRLLDQLVALIGEYDVKALRPVGKDDRACYSGAAAEVVDGLVAVYGLGSMLDRKKVAS